MIIRTALMIILATLFSGCASPPKLYKVESVYVCAAEECGLAAQHYGTEQMLVGLQKLLAANDGQEFKACESDPKTRACMSNGFCHFVQGGPLPGLGCMKSATLTASTFDITEKRVRFQSKPNYTFLGAPLTCEIHGAAITVHSIDEIAWEDSSFYCNWMAIGNMVHTFSFAVESVDFDRGIIGGYWTHSTTGTGTGSGSGYAIFVLPKAMPRDENWLILPAKN
jgi:hypothetical protein